MTEQASSEQRRPRGIGADLVLPVLAALYALYYFYTIADFPREARINGTFIGSVLLALVGVLVIRTLLRVWRGEATLRMTALIEPQEKLTVRVAFIVLTAASILLMPYAGFTLMIFLFLIAAMFMLGVRNLRPLLLVPLLSAAVAYVFFIVLLETRLPSGPVEYLLKGVL